MESYTDKIFCWVLINCTS